MKFTLTYITTESKTQALEIGRALVGERLAACVNVIDGMTSIYRWNNKTVQENEAVLIAKTRESLFDRLAARVKELHSYSTPCIVAVPLIKGNSDYMQWLLDETGVE